MLSDAFLASWAKAPEDGPAQEAYRQIKAALATSEALRHKQIDIYLQGSYRNRTHIKENSDADVVVELQSTFSPDTLSLTPAEKQLFHTIYPQASYEFLDLRRDVEAALVDYFGAASVDYGNKSIKIVGNQRRSAADVVPCLEHRKYTRFRSQAEPYIPGIKLYTRHESREIINWPKIHFENGAAKNDRTDSMYKSTVRICKNLRDFLIGEGHIDDTLAPSYFVECLLYNVPDSLFGGGYAKSLVAAAVYLKQADLGGFCCVSEQDELFTPPSGWKIEDAKNLINWINVAIE